MVVFAKLLQQVIKKIRFSSMFLLCLSNLVLGSDGSCVQAPRDGFEGMDLLQSEVVVWPIDGLELAGEICFEIHQQIETGDHALILESGRVSRARFPYSLTKCI